MRRITLLIGIGLLVTLPGFAEILITAQDYAVDSDVALESAVREVKEIPKDTINVVGDSVKYVSDEMMTVSKGVKAALSGFAPHQKARESGLQAVGNARHSEDDIILRTYDISDEVGRVLMRDSEEQGIKPAVDVSAVFEDVPFPGKSSAFYWPEVNRLFVRQTAGNLAAIEDFLADYHGAQQELMGHQVEIEAKFVEVSQKTLNELGFSWRFASKNNGGLELLDNLVLPAGSDIFAEGLRTAATAFSGGVDPGVLKVAKTVGNLRWDLFISALEQADDSDVLSAPRIVTRTGNAAIIEVGEERMVPKRFAVDSQQTSLYVEHNGWDSALMGVRLKVTPTLRPDGLIDLDLHPRVMDLIGYDDYQVTPDNAVMWPLQGAAYGSAQQIGRYPIISRTIDGVLTPVGELYNSILDAAFLYPYQATAGSEIQPDANNIYQNTPGYYDTRRRWEPDELIAVPSLHGRLPYFRLREIDTQVTVADGSTVGMGGLIYDKLETFRDKVPVLGSIPLLGRLFRSEGERSIKRNLMIFVTASQVDMKGRTSAGFAQKIANH